MKKEWMFHGDRLRRIRRQRGLRLIDVARASEPCAYRHLQQAETGKRNLSIETAHRVADAITRLSGSPVAVTEFMSPVDDVNGAAA